jgi:hypothetical protein
MLDVRNLTLSCGHSSLVPIINQSLPSGRTPNARRCRCSCTLSASRRSASHRTVPLDAEGEGEGEGDVAGHLPGVHCPRRFPLPTREEPTRAYHKGIRAMPSARLANRVVSSDLQVTSKAWCPVSQSVWPCARHVLHGLVCCLESSPLPSGTWKSNAEGVISVMP